MERFRPHDLPPSAADVRRARQRTLDEESAYRLAESNRAKGIAPPEDGGKIFVSTAKGIPNRRRAGLDFSSTDRREVTISMDAPREEFDKLRKGGAYVVDAKGYEEICADDGLVVFSQVSSVRVEENAALSEERDRLLAENAKLRQELLEMRDGAGRSPLTGKPAAAGMPAKPPTDDATVKADAKPSGKTEDAKPSGKTEKTEK